MELGHSLGSYGPSSRESSYFLIILINIMSPSSPLVQTYYVSDDWGTKYHCSSDKEEKYVVKIFLKLRLEMMQLVLDFEQHNRRSLMKLSEVKIFCDGTLMKIRENLIDMVNKNELGRGNKWLKGRDWNDKDIKRSTKMIDKIDQVMKHREQL
ncbi:hypothetical protein Tco_0685714 [Tanacetum coccineum]